MWCVCGVFLLVEDSDLVLRLLLNSGLGQGSGKGLPGGRSKPMRVLIKAEVLMCVSVVF